MNKICIIGVGLIGGSFALGLKNTREIEIVGFGRNEAHLQQAQKLGAIDTATTPFCSLPAMGCAGINLGGMAPNTSLAVAITLPLVLTTSQIIIRSLMCGLITQAIAYVSECWQALGAKVEIMNDKIHDDLLAMTSHLPHMLAFSLMDYLIQSHSNALDYAAGGFKDFSRIASSDATMWRDICINNPNEIDFIAVSLNLDTHFLKRLKRGQGIFSL
jgi:prephenate dehydrogenase